MHKLSDVRVWAWGEQIHRGKTEALGLIAVEGFEGFKGFRGFRVLGFRSLGVQGV